MPDTHKHAWGLSDSESFNRIERDKEGRKIEVIGTTRTYVCMFSSCDETKQDESIVSRDWYRGY